MGITMDLSGLDKLQKELEQMEKAMSALNGTIAEIKFDPHDPESVRAAIVEMERAIDSKILPYRRNPLVADVVKEAKKHYKNEILKRARS